MQNTSTAASNGLYPVHGYTPDSAERRAFPRVKARVPVELCPAGENAPIRGTTSDLSLGGCYIEMIFTLGVDSPLDIVLQIGEYTIPVIGMVATCDPHVGNGIKFTKVLPEDSEVLRDYIAHALDEASDS